MGYLEFISETLKDDAVIRAKKTRREVYVKLIEG